MSAILENENFYRSASVILDLFADILRDYLMDVHNPSLPIHLPRRIRLNQSQTNIIHRIPRLLNYQDCDIPLLYILIRNLGASTPANGWDRPVNAIHVNVADDVERIRQYRNQLYGHMNNCRLDNVTYMQFITDAKSIAGRFDQCHGGTYNRNVVLQDTYSDRLVDMETKPLSESTRNHIIDIYQKCLELEADVRTVETDLDQHKQDVAEGVRKVNEDLTQHKAAVGESVRKVNEDLTQHKAVVGESVRKVNEDLTQHKAVVGESVRKVNEDLTQHKAVVGESVRKVNEDLTQHKAVVGEILLQHKADVDGKIDTLKENVRKSEGSEKNEDAGSLDGLHELLSRYKKDVIKESQSHGVPYVTRRFDPPGTPQKDLKASNAILVSGEAGLGKTLFAKNMELQWALGEQFSDEILLYYNCKYINKIIPINATDAPLYHSSLGLLMRKSGRSDNYFNILKEEACTGNLLIIIDGIDELPIDHCLSRQTRDELEMDINEGNKISGTQTILAILFGYFFPGAKSIVLGRNYEVEKLKKTKDTKSSVIFDKNKRKVIRMLPFTDDDVRKLICNQICGTEYDNYHQEISSSSNKCKEIYEKITHIEFKNIPAYTTCLIDIFSRNVDISVVTKTELFVRVIFNKFLNHTCLGRDEEHKTFRSMMSSKEGLQFKDIMKSLANLAYLALLNDDTVITATSECNEYIKYQNVKLNKDILNKIDMFFIRDENYKTQIEPHHLIFLEFLSACHFATHREEQWYNLLQLQSARLPVVVPFIVGLLSNNNLTNDFLINALDFHCLNEDTVNIFYSFILGIEDSKLSGRIVDDGWYGLSDNGKRTPTFALLHGMSKECPLPQQLLPNQLVCYNLGVDQDIDGLLDKQLMRIYHIGQTEWFYMQTLYNLYTRDINSEMNIAIFCETHPTHNIKINREELTVESNEQASALNTIRQLPQVTIDITRLHISHEINDLVCLQLLGLAKAIRVSTGCGIFSSIMDAIAGKIPVALPTMCIRHLTIDWISHLRGEKDICNLLHAATNVDMLELECEYFTDEQLQIMEKLSADDNTYIPIKIKVNPSRISKYKVTPMVCCVYFSNVRFTEDILQTIYKSANQHQSVPQKRCKSLLHRFKMITRYPFTEYNRDRKCDSKRMRSGLQMVYIHRVGFSDISPDTLANTLTGVPAVWLSYIILCEDRWNRFIEMIISPTSLLQELRLTIPGSTIHNNVYVPTMLFFCCRLPLLQIIFVERHAVLTMLTQLVAFDIIYRNIRVVAYNDDFDDYAEIVVLDTGVSDLNINLNIYKELIRSHRLEFTNEHWCCEIRS